MQVQLKLQQSYFYFQFDMDTFSDQAGDLKWLEGKKASKEAQRRSLLKAAEKLREKQVGTRITEPLDGLLK